MLIAEHLRYDGFFQCRHLRCLIHTTVSLSRVIHAKTAYSNVNIYAILFTLYNISFSIPGSSLDWLPTNPGHGTKMFWPPSQLVSYLLLISDDFSLCTYIAPMSGPKGHRLQRSRIVKSIGTSGTYLS